MSRRGGYQYGAGRPALRARLEDVPHIDIGYWRRIGLLKPGEEGRCYARVPALQPLAYATTVEAVSIVLAQNGARLAQRLPVHWTPCYFGGRRPWFSCPACKASTMRLYLQGGQFACRRCTGLTYPTQRDNPRARELRRIGFYPPHQTLEPAW